MKNYKDSLLKTGGASLLAATLALTLAGCGSSKSSSATQTAAESATETAAEQTVVNAEDIATSMTTANVSTGGAIDTTDLFSERDLTQVADTSDATQLAVTSGQDIQITEEGVYVITGEATDVTITVNVEDSEKVQLVLDGVSITNADFPAIYVVNADKVFVTTAAGTTNTLQVTGSFVADGDTNTDAVIFSKDDLVLNGQGTLVVSSTANGITSKDDLKVTGGSYNITSAADALEANESILVADGSFNINSSKDGLHAEDSDDNSTGLIYICGGSFDINAASDGIQATTILQIDGGSFQVNAGEALEATYIQINGGDLDIAATDDGINASTKSSSVGTPTIEITGGSITINMGSGDTDAIDANGNLIISGGEIDITAQFAFDFDGSVSFTGGTVTVNGEQVTEISSSMMMGGGMMGGMGQPGGGMAPQGNMGGGPRG